MSRRDVRQTRRAGSVAPPFTPKSLTGLVAWYRADLGITLDGSNNVQQWNDQSGNGNTMTQGTPASRPGWSASGGANSQAKLTMASTLGLSIGSAIISAGHTRTVWAVAKRTAAGSLVCFASNSPTLEIQLLKGGNGLASDQVTYTDTTTYSPDTNPHLFEYDCTVGSAVVFFVDNASQSVAGGNITSETGTAAFGIGTFPLGTGFAGDLEEIIIVDHVASSGERANVHAYAQARYATS